MGRFLRIEQDFLPLAAAPHSLCNAALKQMSFHDSLACGIAGGFYEKGGIHWNWELFFEASRGAPLDISVGFKSV